MAGKRPSPSTVTTQRNQNFDSKGPKENGNGESHTSPKCIQNPNTHENPKRRKCAQNPPRPRPKALTRLGKSVYFPKADTANFQIGGCFCCSAVIDSGTLVCPMCGLGHVSSFLSRAGFWSLLSHVCSFEKPFSDSVVYRMKNRVHFSASPSLRRDGSGF